MSENCLSFKVRPAQHIMCSLLTVWYIVCDGDQPLFCKRACWPRIVGIVFMLVLFDSAWGYGNSHQPVFCKRACWHHVYACSLCFGMGLWYIVLYEGLLASCLCLFSLFQHGAMVYCL